MSKKRPSERRLVDVLMSYLRDGQHVTMREVPHYERRIDVALIFEGTDELWAIEAKTSDWQRALSQAIVNLSAAERSYIAIHSACAHRVSQEDLRRHGIGLLAVGTKWGDVSVMWEAEKSPYTNPLAANRIRSTVLEES